MTAERSPNRPSDRPFAADTGRLFAAAVLLFSAGALAVAYTAQWGFGLEPCPLCLWQRVPYGVAAVLALCALAPRMEPWRPLILAVCGIAFASGAAIAVYHFGVEQQWWRSAICAGGIPGPLTTAELLAALNEPAPKPCDAVDWTVFGLSITAYNAAVSATLALFAVIGAWRVRHEGR
ncbi:MAG: disulfide bond formation protein B [Proteobacteria bacterium]|jgi:disulfide bond formation protein DsbB|nr:disulfide bond formation protein B [Pseudomonadota bacterium]